MSSTVRLNLKVRQTTLSESRDVLFTLKLTKEQTEQSHFNIRTLFCKNYGGGFVCSSTPKSNSPTLKMKIRQVIGKLFWQKFQDRISIT
jgi:hypothetical protein